jgi:hypothetical protein
MMTSESDFKEFSRTELRPDFILQKDIDLLNQINETLVEIIKQSKRKYICKMLFKYSED